MIKVCIFNKSNDVSKFDVFKKFFWECQLQDISDMLRQNRCSLSKCAWQWEENGKFDIPVDSILLENTSWWVFKSCTTNSKKLRLMGRATASVSFRTQVVLVYLQ